MQDRYSNYVPGVCSVYTNLPDNCTGNVMSQGREFFLVTSHGVYMPTSSRVMSSWVSVCLFAFTQNNAGDATNNEGLAQNGAASTPDYQKRSSVSRNRTHCLPLEIVLT